MKSARHVAVVLALLLSGLPVLGVAQIAAADPPGQPEGASTQAETLYAGVAAYSVMKTENGFLGLGLAAVNAFAPITLPCPASAGANGCTIRVVLSSQFWDIPATATAQVNLTITGAGTLGPANLVNVASNTSATLAETHTMQWIKRNVPAGTAVTVSATINMTSGTGSAGYRTIWLGVQDWRRSAIRTYLAAGFVPFIHAPDPNARAERWRNIFDAIGLASNEERWPRTLPNNG